MANSVLTKKIFAQALKELMQTRSFEKISIADITQACGMNRNSFYYHFKDKYELVNWIFFTEITKEITANSSKELTTWEVLNKIAHYFYQNRSFYINVFQYQGQNSFSTYFKEALKSMIDEKTTAAFTETIDPEFENLYQNWLLDALVQFFIDWLNETEVCPPDHLIKMLKQATYDIAKKVLKKD